MRKSFVSLLLLAISGALFACEKEKTQTNTQQTSTTTTQNIRVPAEWEQHAATWMQWPGIYEKPMRKAFCRIIAVIQQYEKVHLLANSNEDIKEAKALLLKEGVIEKNTEWHVVKTDNAWMRDSGPIYVTNGKEMWIQNWKFDGWDKSAGASYQFDNQVPVKVGQITGLKVKDHTSYVLEKGNIEFNGQGVALLNWDCQKNRNPHLNKTQHEAILKNALGLKDIIWAYGYHPKDLTTGHIDGTARFVSKNTVVVADYHEIPTEDNLANELTKKGFKVIRYTGDPNWLVGNGFVVARGEGDQYDADLKAQLQKIWPNHKIHIIYAKSIAKAGGGIHCVTNDQPLFK